MNFKTPKGTTLPMLDLRGRPYLQVAHRVVWFREEHNDWGIETEQLTIDIDTGRALFVARIKDDTGRIIATATGHETKGDFPDFIEKAETKAIGRALALCGYGTQFAPELDEGERPADTPVKPAKPAVKPTTKPSPLAEIRDLAVRKLGADPIIEGDVLAKLNDRFKFGFEKSSDIKSVHATTILKALRSMPDAEPLKDSPKTEDGVPIINV